MGDEKNGVKEEDATTNRGWEKTMSIGRERETDAIGGKAVRGQCRPCLLVEEAASIGGGLVH